jgi:nicotinate-nucleotide adenylyltransferase
MKRFYMIYYQSQMRYGIIKKENEAHSLSEVAMNIIFGGSFNPPTIAHYEIAKYLLDKFPQANLVLLPNGDRYPRKQLASSEDRLHMLTLMALKLGSRVTVSDIEIRSPKFLGTYYTLQQFDHPYFVIGMDSLADLPTWIAYEKLVAEHHFLVIKRENFQFDCILESIPYLKQWRHHFTLLDDFPMIKLSSTSFRKNKDYQLLIPEIKDYIIEHKLY